MMLPPVIALWLLQHRLSPEWREFVVGDLEEEFRVRAAISPRGARAWFWWQTVRCLIRPPAARPECAGANLQRDPMTRMLLTDFRYGLRTIVRAPGFAMAVIAVLALGIGANTAIFSIVNTVLLRPLPFEQSDQLVRLFHDPPQGAFPGIRQFPVSPANFFDWKRDAQSFDGMAIYRFRQFTLTGLGEAEAVLAGAVGADFFAVVRAKPSIGRTFVADEDTPGRSHVVVVSDRFWRSHLNAATDVLRRTLTLDGQAYQIVGVMPARFTVESWLITARDLWVPLAYTDAARLVRDNHNAQAIARLTPGVGLDAAQTEMNVLSARLERAYPEANAGWGATVVPLQELIVGDVRSSLVMLLAAVGLVLLIASANAGNLLFARALGRRKEIAVRAALGAGRARVFQQLVVEAVVLSLSGGMLGLVLARLSLIATGGLLADQLQRADEMSMDLRVVIFTVGLSLLTGILAGGWPALRAGRTDLNEALREGGRSDGAVGLRTRRLLIAGEVALSVVLLMGAGVMLRSLLSLRQLDVGFNPRQVLTMEVQPPATKYDTPQRKTAFFDAALERIRALPGVQAAGVIDDLPLTGGSVQPIVVEGRPELLPRDQPTTEVRLISPGYLQAMQIPLLRGRDVQPSDNQTMLVSASAARLLWGAADPIGQRVTLPLQSRTVVKEVIGIVGDVKQGELSAPAGPTVYQYTRERDWPGMTLAIRTASTPMTLRRAVVSAIHAIDPQQPVQNIRTMDDVIDATLASRRFSAVLLAVFAGVALALASLGIYSVLAYIVRGRSREFGIRSALGARTPDVLRMVVLEGLTPTCIGIGIGAVAALGAARLLDNMVFGVSAADPLTFVIVVAGLVVVAVAASLVPAYRASRLDPLKVLRSTS